MSDLDSQNKIMEESSGEEAYEDFATAIYSQQSGPSSSGPPSPVIDMDSTNIPNLKTKNGNDTVTEDDTTDDGGVWKTYISRGKTGSQRERKRQRTSSTILESPTKRNHRRTVELSVTVEGVDTNIAKINPVKMAKFLHQEVGQVEKVERRRKSLKIICKNVKQVTKLKNTIDFAGMTVKVSQYDPNEHKKKAVIRVSTDVEEKDLLELLKKDKVVAVKRFKKKINGEMKNTPSVLLTFDRKEIPKELLFAFERYKVSEYVPPVPRCFKCQRFGHVADGCYSKARCVRCGGEHSYNECENKETPKCCRCNENHSAAYLGCGKYKEAIKIQSLKLSENISYAAATKKFHGTKIPVPAQAERNNRHLLLNNNQQKTQINEREPQPEPQPGSSRTLGSEQGRNSTPNTQAQRITKKKPTTHTSAPLIQSEVQLNESENILKNFDITVNSLDFLAFIVFVINNVEHETTNSNRIRLVVEAARYCLGVNTIHPEMIHERLR